MKYKKLVLIGLVILLPLFAFVAYKASKPVDKPTPQPSGTAVQKATFKQILNYGNYKPEETVDVEFNNDESVLDALEKTAEVQTKEYSFGKLVESINGVKNGTDNKYWIYYINGEEAKVGASEYKLQNGDTIEWKFKIYEE